MEIQRRDPDRRAAGFQGLLWAGSRRGPQASLDIARPKQQAGSDGATETEKKESDQATRAVQISITFGGPYT